MLTFKGKIHLYENIIFILITYVVLIVEVIFFFEAILIFEIVFIFGLLFIFNVVFIFGVVLIFGLNLTSKIVVFRGVDFSQESCWAAKVLKLVDIDRDIDFVITDAH